MVLWFFKRLIPAHLPASHPVQIKTAITFAINDIQKEVKSIYKAAGARWISPNITFILHPYHRPTASKIAAKAIAAHEPADLFSRQEFVFSGE